MMSSEESFVCSICLQFESEVSPNWFVATPMGHVFHFNGCLKEWIYNGGSWCPLCNETIYINNLTRLFGIEPSSKHDGTKELGGTSGLNSDKAASVSLHEDPEKFLISRNPDYTFKIVLLGDPAVGKSSLLQRYSHGVFNYTISPTIGCEVAFKTIEIGGKLIKMNLWDTGGQQVLKAISKNFVRNAHGAVLTYNYREVSSLESIKSWLDFIDCCGIPGAAVLLVANKLEIPAEQQSIKTDQGQNVARMLGLQFFETSGRDDYNNVDAVFRALAVEIIDRIESKQFEYRNPQQDRENRIRLCDEEENNVLKNQKNSKCW